MQVKFFEICDRGTFIPALAVHLFVDSRPERNPYYNEEIFLLRRAGYAMEQIVYSNAEPYILLSKLDGVKANYDPFAWDSSTMREAHRCIIANWNDLRSGDVIDAEFIRGETHTPKISERLER